MSNHLYQKFVERMAMDEMEDLIELTPAGKPLNNEQGSSMNPITIITHPPGRPPQKRRAETLSSPEVSPILPPALRNSANEIEAEILLAQAFEILTSLYDRPELDNPLLAKSIRSIDAVRKAARFQELSTPADPWATKTTTTNEPIRQVIRELGNNYLMSWGNSWTIS